MAVWQVGDPIPGFGAGTTGHAAGAFTTYTVTATGNAGAGTLREFVENRSGPRLIQFASNARDIILTGELTVTSGDLTIDGYSAGGVQIRNHTVKVHDGNVILAHLKFRAGDEGGGDYESRDGLSVGTGGVIVSPIALMQCEFSWGVDENMELWQQARDVTIWQCLSAEALYNSVHPEGIHSMGMLFAGSAPGTAGWRPEFVTVGRTCFAANNRRNPRLGDGHRVEIVNCIAYNFGAQAIEFASAVDNDVDDTFCGYNWYSRGLDTTRTVGKMISTGNANCWIIGNRLDDQAGNPYGGDLYDGGGFITKTVPAWASGAHTASTAGLWTSVLDECGARPDNRDTATTRIIAGIVARNLRFADTIGSTVAENGLWPAQPTFSEGITLTAGLYLDPDVFHSPTVTTPPPTTQLVTLGPVGEADVFYSPVIGQSAPVQEVTLGPVSSADSFFSATISVGAFELVVPYLDDAATDLFLPMLIEVATQTLDLPFFDDAATDDFFAISITMNLFVAGFDLDPDDVDDVFYPITLTQITHVTLPFFDDAATDVFHPIVLNPVTGLDVPFFDDAATDAFHAITLTTLNSVVVPFFDDADVFFGVSLSGGTVAEIPGTGLGAGWIVDREPESSEDRRARREREKLRKLARRVVRGEDGRDEAEVSRQAEISRKARVALVAQLRAMAEAENMVATFAELRKAVDDEALELKRESARLAAAVEDDDISALLMGM